jgi:hypothetical protein
MDDEEGKISSYERRKARVTSIWRAVQFVLIVNHILEFFEEYFSEYILGGKQ